MSASVVRPIPWKNAELVEVESDATTPIAAVVEIDTWAAKHHYLRSNEGWPRAVLRSDGKRVFHSICYRPTQEDLNTLRAEREARHESLRRQAQTG